MSLAEYFEWQAYDEWRQDQAEDAKDDPTGKGWD